MYDYLLVIGPGRSGSEFLYRNLKGHRDFAFPEIKEGIYYRSPKAFKRARQRLHGKQRMLLCDIANSAYCDPALFSGIEALGKKGIKILLMVLIRNHRDRAISMLWFRKSRGEPSALFGSRRLEEVIVRDRLVPKMLLDIFRIKADILTVSFSALTKDTAAVLEVLASLCQTSGFDSVLQEPVNEVVSPRFVWFSALGWLCGRALRKLGFRRLLQRAKDNQLLKSVFFVPWSKDEGNLCLSEKSLKTLDTSYSECWSIVENSSEQIGRGIYFRKFNLAERLS